MRVGDLVVLDQCPGAIHDPFAAICGWAYGKTVLNVGAAGNAALYNKRGDGEWLHAKLSQVSSRLLGLDIDAEQCGILKNMGFEVEIGNCETIKLNKKFDLIVMSDVIEHVSNPGLALTNLAAHLNNGGHIVLTTPNATYLGNMVGAILARSPNTFWDHVSLFGPENIQALCDRHDLLLERVDFFTHLDRRSFSTWLKSSIIRLIARLFPRMHGFFLCKIRPGK